MTALKAGPAGKMTERIVAGFDPVRVILFGSLARGEAGYDSDIDLLVLRPRTDEEDRKA